MAITNHVWSTTVGYGAPTHAPGPRGEDYVQLDAAAGSNVWIWSGTAWIQQTGGGGSGGLDEAALKTLFAQGPIHLENLGTDWDIYLLGPGLKRAIRTLTDAQIKALPTTPVEIVPAAGAGKVNLPSSLVAYLEWVSDYTNIDAAAQFHLAAWADEGVPLSYLDQSVATATVSKLLAKGEDSYAIGTLGNYLGDNNSLAYAGIRPSVVVNTPLIAQIFNGESGNLTGGNAGNSLRVIVDYSEIDV